MEVILLERIEKLGKIGDVVSVKPGYARNFLLPQSKALRATKTNRESFEAQRAEIEALNEKRRGDAAAASGSVEGVSVILVRQASDSGQLYGSVRPRDIAQALTEQGAEVDRTQVRLGSPIKTIGLHTVRIALHPEVVVEVTVNVARSPEEAELQAQGRSLREEEMAAEREAEEAARAAIGMAAAEAEAEDAGEAEDEDEDEAEDTGEADAEPAADEAGTAGDAGEEEDKPASV